MSDGIDLEKKSGFTNLSVVGEESEDEGREDEIKELLAHAFSNESFGVGDDDDDLGDDNEHGHNNGIGIQAQQHENNSPNHHQPISFDGLPTPRADLGGAGESILHKTHCPSINFNGDSNGNYEKTWTVDNHEAESLEELKTISEFRERQVQRAEERIEILSKEKRSLAHQLGLMKAEALGMKSTEDELQKALRLKEEENVFLKEKVEEILREYEQARKSESETKDQNILLQSQIGKLTQEVRLLSAIGLSTKESELNDALRETRQKHVTEVNFWRDRVEELEKNIKDQQKVVSDLRNSQTKKTFSNAEIQVSSDNLEIKLKETKEAHEREKSIWINNFKILEENFHAQLKQAREASAAPAPPVSSENLEIKLRETMEAHEREKGIWINNFKTLEENFHAQLKQAREASAPAPPLPPKIPEPKILTSVEIQTDENMKTYQNLAALIEQWGVELRDACERADQAEADAAEMEKALRHLHRKFKTLKKVVYLCRKEWRTREDLLIQKYNDSKEHYIKVLAALVTKFKDIEQETSNDS